MKKKTVWYSFFEDLKELSKEMEQISDQNDQEKNSEEDSQ